MGHRSICALLVFGSLGTASANVRISNLTPDDVRVEIQSDTMNPLHYLLPEQMLDSDYGSYGMTRVVIRPCGQRGVILCRGDYPSGTVLVLEKRQNLYRLTEVKHPLTPH